MKIRVEISKLVLPYEDYKYDAKVWQTIDGRNWYHCGYGRYCKTLEEALQYKKENEKEM